MVTGSCVHMCTYTRTPWLCVRACAVRARAHVWLCVSQRETSTQRSYGHASSCEHSCGGQAIHTCFAVAVNKVQLCGRTCMLMLSHHWNNSIACGRTHSGRLRLPARLGGAHTHRRTTYACLFLQSHGMASPPAVRTLTQLPTYVRTRRMSADEALARNCMQQPLWKQHSQCNALGSMRRRSAPPNTTPHAAHACIGRYQEFKRRKRAKEGPRLPHSCRAVCGAPAKQPLHTQLAVHPYATPSTRKHAASQMHFACRRQRLPLGHAAWAKSPARCGDKWKVGGRRAAARAITGGPAPQPADPHGSRPP